MFGFLKNKLKEWVDTAKDKLKAEEKPAEEKVSSVSEEIDVSKKPEKLFKKQKKEKKAKKGIIKETLELKPEEDGTAIEIETELEEGVPQDIIEEELEEKEEEKLEELEKKELVASEKDEEIVREENEKIQEITEELGKGEISAKEAVKEIEEVHEKTEEQVMSTEKKGFFKKLFGRKEKPSSATEVAEDSKIASEAVEKKGFFEKVKFSLSYKITEEDFNSLFDGLEMLLLENNVALDAVEDIKLHLSKKLVGREISKNELENEIRKELKSSLEEIMIEPENPLELIKIKKQEKDEPFVILFFGINGTGKTTSIAKIAHLLKSNNLSVVLAAADTFRAASIEQISEHADRLKVPLIKQNYGADPAAVGFDAIKYAQSHKIDVVLIDTAGRMHTKTNLISEMEKICRVTKPDLKIFVAESIAGNDATEQAKTFNEAVGIDGSILSKADVDEKGGTIISVSHITHKPIIYLGTGQGYEDIKLFNKEDFIKSLGL